MVQLVVPLIWQGVRTAIPNLLRGIAIDKAFGVVRNAVGIAFNIKRSSEEVIPQGLSSTMPPYESTTPQRGDSSLPAPPALGSTPPSPSYMEGVELGLRIDKLTRAISQLENEFSDDIQHILEGLGTFSRRLSALEALRSPSPPTISASLHASTLNAGLIADSLSHIGSILEGILASQDRAEKHEGEREGTVESSAAPINLHTVIPRNNAERIALAQAQMMERQSRALEKHLSKIGQYYGAKVDTEIEGMNALNLELSHAYIRYKLDAEKLQKYTVNNEEYTFTQLQAMQNLSTIAPLYELNKSKVSLSELEAMSKIHHLTKQSIKIGDQTVELSPADVAAEKNYQLAIPYTSDMRALNDWSVSSASTPAISAIQAQKVKDTIDAKEKYTEANFDFSELLDTDLPAWDQVKELFKFSPLSAQIEEAKRRGI